MSALYSLRTDGDQYRITKFTDGEVESSYLCTQIECECPAGHRHTCRHRQMLPQMLAHNLANTHWFFDYDGGGRIVDFNGASKHLMDQLAAIPGVQVVDMGDPATLHNTIADALGEPRLVDHDDVEIIEPNAMVHTRDGYIAHEAGLDAKDVTPVPEGQHCEVTSDSALPSQLRGVVKIVEAKPWRRM